MQSAQEVAPFRAFRPFLLALRIYDSANFRHGDRRIVVRHGCIAVLFTMMILSFVLFALNDALFCIATGFDLSAIALPFGLVITCSLFAAIYMSFGWNIRVLEGLIDSLTEMTTERKCILLFGAMWSGACLLRERFPQDQS